MRMRLVLLAAVLCSVPAAPAVAVAAPLPPSLSPDFRFGLPLVDGIARSDLTAGTIEDIPTAVAVDGDRVYTVGRTRGDPSGGQDIGIVARKVGGGFDTAFSGDGKLIISIATGTGNDAGIGIVVLPDRRIRVIAATASVSADVAIVGLKADGTRDTTFGELVAVGGTARTGQIVFSPGPNADIPHRIVAGPGGRLAIVGTRRDTVSRDDFFVSLREANGMPATFGTSGVKSFNRGGSPSTGVAPVDRGIDVVFRPGGGLLALLMVEKDANTSAFDYAAVLHAFTASGADDTSFAGTGDLELTVGAPDTVPGGLVEYGGRYYVSGSTVVGAATHGFIARVNANGSGLDYRRFDIRGRVVPAGQPVTTWAGKALTSTSADIVAPGDLVVVPGLPTTLVAVGSVEYSLGTGTTEIDWAAAAFNNFDGRLAAAGFGDVVLQAPGRHAISSAAAGASGWLAVAGRYELNFDTSYGNARLMIDADKACDLAVQLAEPNEITFRGSADAVLSATVTNEGTLPCRGVIGVPSPYRLAASSTGELAPGGRVVINAGLAYGGPRRPEDILTATVTAAGDANPTNDRAAVHVVFSYCELALEGVGGAGWIPTEGARRFELNLRNNGTTACSVRLGSKPSYRLEGGKSVSDRLAMRAPRSARPGTRVRVALRASAAGDVEPGNNAIARSPRVVGVGDSSVGAWGARRFAGRASAGKAKGMAAAKLRPARVHVALLRKGGKTCGWLRSARGDFTRRKPGKEGRCGDPRWLRAEGTRSWRFRLRRSLPAGSYVIHSRTTIGAGFPEARFSADDRNKVEFRVG
jgi:hypothetical protein